MYFYYYLFLSYIMPTPTGYTFLYNSVQTDFADVFDITSPGSVTTGYYSTAYNKDLGFIFTTGNSGITTNYKYSTNVDLGSIFSNTPPAPYVTTGTVTTTSDGTYNTILTWTSNGTIKFNQNAIVGTAPQAIVTGGGSGGQSGQSYFGTGGTGGGGAPPNTILNLNYPTVSTTYTITIGAGGQGGYYDNFLGEFIDPVNGSSSVFAYTSTYTGVGGTILLGGVGGTSNTPGTAGTNNFGGGGGGGSNTATTYSGGLGGPSGGGSGGKGGASGGGGAGKGTNGQNGQQRGGGGGGGGCNGNGYNPPTPAYALGGNGAAGSVVFKFNI